MMEKTNNKTLNFGIMILFVPFLIFIILFIPLFIFIYFLSFIDEKLNPNKLSNEDQKKLEWKNL